MSFALKILFSLLFMFTFQNNSNGQSSSNYKALVGMKEGRSISKGEFLAQQGVGGERYISDSHWEHIPIDSFTIIVLRGNAMILHKNSSSQYFSVDLKEQLKSLTTNDIVIIYNIYGREVGNNVVFLKPLQFIIK